MAKHCKEILNKIVNTNCS